MDAVFERLTIWLAPLMCFTTEEAWAVRHPDGGSNCLRVMPETPADWRNDAEAERWSNVEQVTRVVTSALEVERREKRIGGALDAAPLVYIQSVELLGAFHGLDPAEVFRTSQATLLEWDDGSLTSSEPGTSLYGSEEPLIVVRTLRAEGKKCARSWRILPEVGADPRYPELSLRDADAVAWWDQNRGSSAP
jgi:isoleucyl-tRNA synthetase